MSFFQILLILRRVFRRIKFGCHFFSYRSLLLSTSVLNDNLSKMVIRQSNNSNQLTFRHWCHWFTKFLANVQTQKAIANICIFMFIKGKAVTLKIFCLAIYGTSQIHKSSNCFVRYKMENLDIYGTYVWFKVGLSDCVTFKFMIVFIKTVLWFYHDYDQIRKQL